jgi:hypothetical protein
VCLTVQLLARAEVFTYNAREASRGDSKLVNPKGAVDTRRAADSGHEQEQSDTVVHVAGGVVTDFAFRIPDFIDRQAFIKAKLQYDFPVGACCRGARSSRRGCPGTAR